MTDRKILLVDGNNAAWRLMYKLPPLSVKGELVQVVYGFLRLLHSVIQQFEPNVALVIWDSGHSQFRKKIFPSYKGNRHYEDKRKELKSVHSQMDILNGLLEHLNVPVMTWPGTEADDIIGLSCIELEGQKTVVSADRDMLQLVSDSVQVWSPMKSELYTAKNFKYKVQGLTPHQYLEMRALTGDGSDAIPGVAKGFGEATASELIHKYGTIEKLFSPEVEKKVYNKGNRYKLLYADGAREAAFRNLILMDLSVCGHAVKRKEEALRQLKQIVRFRKKVDRGEVQRIFLDKAFKSLLEDFGSWISPFESLDWQEQE